MLATNINFSDTKEPNVISFSSSGPAEGKTITATNVAISYAQSGKKTLLMDADMRRPRVEKILGIKTKDGLVNHLLRHMPIEQVIQKPIEELENFSVLPVGVLPPNPTTILTSNEFKDLLDRLKEYYEKIVIDLPPIMVAPDAVIASRYTDGLVLVTRYGQTMRPTLKSAYENILTSGTNIIGTVINDVDEKSSNYYYYYYYYYYSENSDESKKRKRKARTRR
jgi:capsular exopolysaccharide synthesis family protein